MEFKLPIDVMSQIDAMRLAREVNRLEDFFAGVDRRQPGTSMQLPRLSHLLDILARENGLNLLKPQDRQHLTAGLDTLLSRAPLVHISFAADPPPKALQQILIWLRSNIHPHILLQIGLQPNIAAGCVLRTPNKSFDMSLRAHLEKQQNYLMEMIGKIAG